MNYRKIYNERLNESKVDTIKLMLLERGLENSGSDFTLTFVSESISFYVDFAGDYIRVRSDYRIKDGSVCPPDEYIVNQISYDYTINGIIKRIDDIFIERLDDCEYFK
jgi:hypothetical protein